VPHNIKKDYNVLTLTLHQNEVINGKKKNN